MEVNETGTFMNSDGVTGTWTAMAYIVHNTSKPYSNVSMISLNSYLVNGNKYSMGTHSRSNYIDAEGETFWSTNQKTWTFVEDNGKHTLIGNSSVYANGRAEMTSVNTAQFFIMGTELTNMSNYITVTFTHTNINETIGNVLCLLDGNTNMTSIPLNVSASAVHKPNGHFPSRIVHKQFKPSEKTHTTVNFRGNFTAGDEGVYYSQSNGTSISATATISTSLSLDGHYSVTNKLLNKQHPSPLQSLIMYFDLFKTLIY
ncbi:hypothetical protein SK128_017640 [Halocaridina rubra]|uniref:Uncharacterized protein n=1 Tax=Halocaridina rubra TaxID=373956 RepID=A0AAN9AEN1_HALRR